MKKIIDWYFDVIRQFIILESKCPFILIFLSMTLQVLTLTSFVLPLKMIFLISAEEFTPISVSFFKIYEKTDLAIVFALIMGVMFFIMFVLERYFAFLQTKCLVSINKKTKKISLYPNQRQIEKNLYLKFILSLSGFIFIGFILLVVLYLYVQVFICLIVYWTIAIAALIYLFHSHKKLKMLINDELPTVLNNISLIGFFCAFSIIVADFISIRPSVSFIYALISLILIRQLTGIIISSVQNVKVLYNQRLQLNNIFLNNMVPLKSGSLQKSNFLSLLEGENFIIEINKTFEVILNEPVSIKSYKLYDTKIQNVVTLIFIVKHTSNQEYSYLAHIYNTNTEMIALNNELLYSQSVFSNLTIDFIGADKVNKYYLHLFKFNTIQRISEKDFFIKKLQIFNRLLLIELSNELIQQYQNTHKFIYERLTSEMLIPIKLVVESTDEELIHWFENYLSRISNQVKTLPLRLVLPMMSKSLLIQENNEVKLLSLHNWSIEPIGYGLNDNLKEKDIIKNILGNKGYDLACIVQHMKLFERNYNQFNFKESIENIRAIQKIYINTSL